MFSHIMIGSNDIARSKKFYDALFTAMGAQPATPDARGRLAYSHNGGRFMVSKPIAGTRNRQPKRDRKRRLVARRMSYRGRQPSDGGRPNGRKRR